MATIVCQGLQSCLDSQLVEWRTLRLKLSSPKTHFPQPPEFGQKCQTSTASDYYGGWSFIQALSDTSKGSTQKEKPYVPPQMKHSLSEKSLELCTENLGSETGTDITEDSILSMSSSDSKESECSLTRKQQKARRGNSRSFPPPLTTMSGSESLQVRPLREDGRLIIEAVKAPSTQTYFQAERSHGRLRLTLFKDFSSSSSSSSSSCSSFDYFNDADSEENEEEVENDNNNELVAK